MKLRYIATAVISLLIILVEALWLFVSVRYGFIVAEEVSSYIPVLIAAFFVPFLIGAILSGMLLITSSKSFRKKRFYSSVNWVALIVALLGLTVVAIKKVPVKKLESTVNPDITIKALAPVKAIVETPVEVKKEKAVIVEKEKPTLLETEDPFKAMKNSCFKSHSPDDGFNQVQMLAYCECVVEDAKSSMTLVEIKSITKSLSTTETSGEALLENDAMVGIVVECIAKVSAKE